MGQVPFDPPAAAPVAPTMPGTGVGGLAPIREGAHVQVDDADERDELATVADPPPSSTLHSGGWR